MEFNNWADRLNFIDAIITHPKINFTSKAVLIKLLHYEGRKDHCWPSQKALMKDLGISQATLTRCLSELKITNLLETEKADIKNTYKILQIPGFLGTQDPACQLLKNEQSHCSKMSSQLLKNEQYCNEQLKRTTEKESRNVNISVLCSERSMMQKIPKVPAQVKCLIDYYYNSPEIKKNVPAETTKIYKTLVQTTKGILNGSIINGDSAFKDYKHHKFTLKEIKHAIDLHNLALSEDYYPENKKHLNIHLHDFLYSPFQKINKSYLVKWITSPPQKVPEYIQNVGNRGQPIIVNHIMKSQGWDKLIPIDMEKLVKASVWIYDYFMNNQDKWGHGPLLPTAGGISKVILDVVKEEMEGKEIKPGFYSSNFFLKNLLPKYCQRKGIMHE